MLHDCKGRKVTRKVVIDHNWGLLPLTWLCLSKLKHSHTHYAIMHCKINGQDLISRSPQVASKGSWQCWWTKSVVCSTHNGHALGGDGSTYTSWVLQARGFEETPYLLFLLTVPLAKNGCGWLGDLLLGRHSLLPAKTRAHSSGED